MNANGKPVEILTKLNEMAGFAADEEITLFEVNRLFPRLLLQFSYFVLRLIVWHLVSDHLTNSLQRSGNKISTFCDV